MKQSVLALLLGVALVSACAYDFGPDTAGAGAEAATGTPADSSSSTGADGPQTVASTTGTESASTSGVVSATNATSSGGAVEPRDCAAILALDPGAGDGVYPIDPDQEGGDPPFEVECDMTTQGGGWTRFNWLEQDFPVDADPLAKRLVECNVDDTWCPGRIPEPLVPEDLLVRDLSDDAYAMWTFDETPVSQAALAALQLKTKACIRDDAQSWWPSLDASDEGYCFDQAGGCDSFKYADGMCHGADRWILTLDDDSHWCEAAFKLGKATGGGNCGNVDWGFLDGCDCADSYEHGALYFR